MTVLTTHDDRPKRGNGAKHNGAARVAVHLMAHCHDGLQKSRLLGGDDEGAIGRNSDAAGDCVSPCR
jgi:hypothetical protein